MSIRLAVIGLGKIAIDQHLPALTRQSDFELVATVDPTLTTDPQARPATFDSIAALKAADLGVDAITLAVPPQVRHELACQAIEAGWHVMLEKPPGITLSEVADLAARAERTGVVLYASWHSRHAPAIEAAGDYLAERHVTHVAIDWREDVTVFHPGQAWIWQPGGLGVFDPGINALSIATVILARPFALRRATLDVPANCDTPIAAELVFEDETGSAIEAVFDFRHKGEPGWRITVTTDDGTLHLADGGARMEIDGRVVIDQAKDEYAGVYARYARLIQDGTSDLDIAPFRHVADAFLLGQRRSVAAFHE